ncbi:MAG: pyridoxamine 5'-phosphate oxidase [Pseudomonadota bacterium]
MTDRSGIFAGDDPFELARDWLGDMAQTEPNDPNAIALATIDADGMPNVRMVLLKDIDADSFVFYTNYGSVKAAEALGAGTAAFVLHSKTQRRQIRVRGTVSKENGAQADAYFASRSLASRIGAWASKQSTPLATRQALMDRTQMLTEQMGDVVPRPAFWGGIRITPVEIEFWADGDARLHDRFRWTKGSATGDWEIKRLNP